MGYVYEALQWLILWVVLVPLQSLARVLRAIHPAALGTAIGRGPYYWAVVRKRRARGEDEWQEHDHVLGIEDPSAPKPTETGGLRLVSNCKSCGNSMYGGPEEESWATCFACWRHDVTERLDA